MHALVSIHDLNPEQLPQIQQLIDCLPEAAYSVVSLLVVPGLPWRPEHIRQLQRWQARGLRLAGHGWLHHVEHIRGWRHRLHACLISRNVAEHLALSSDEILALLQRCHAWFAAHDLAAPDYYVPPAWAMGAIDRAALSQAPFRYYETTAGILDAQSGRYRTLPLVGYEADTVIRRHILHGWNACNRALSSPQRPLRLSLHPLDLSLLLHTELRSTLTAVSHWRDYRNLFDAT